MPANVSTTVKMNRGISPILDATQRPGYSAQAVRQECHFTGNATLRAQGGNCFRLAGGHGRLEAQNDLR